MSSRQALRHARFLLLAALSCIIAGCGASPTTTALFSASSAAVPPIADVLTFHNNNLRTGVQWHETVLTAANVRPTTFGKLYSFTVDGNLYAQPLFVTGYTMADGKAHNVLFAATAHGTIYAFDADNHNPPRGSLWSKSLIPAGEAAVTPSDYGCGNPAPESVVIGTPVIDRASGALYVVSKTKSTAGGTHYVQRIHALNLADGTEKYSGPAVIQASVPGSGGTVSFNPIKENQRAALVLADGNIYIAWASHCDIGPYHGWVLGYDALNLRHQTAIFNDTPTGVEGGIWMSAGGIAADLAGNLYVASGNGTFDANKGGLDFANSVIRFSSTLKVADYFAPANEAALSAADLDVGTAEPLLFSSTNGATPDRLLADDKTGRLYLLDIHNLGKFQTGAGGKNGDIQDFTLNGRLFSQPAYFNGRLYVGALGLPLEAFAFEPASAKSGGIFNTKPISVTSHVFSPAVDSGGTAPTISTNLRGGTSAIVWAVDLSGTHTVLHAYDAANLATELYNSDQAPSNRDLGVPPIRFQSAVIANAHVFVAGQKSIAVYGLLSK